MLVRGHKCQGAVSRRSAQESCPDALLLEVSHQVSTEEISGDLSRKLDLRAEPGEPDGYVGGRSAGMRLEAQDAGVPCERREVDEDLTDGGKQETHTIAGDYTGAPWPDATRSTPRMISRNA